MGGNDFSISDAGVLPFPLRTFEALQHAHLRRVLKFVESKMVAAVELLSRSGPLAVLLNDGKPYEVKGTCAEGLACVAAAARCSSCYGRVSRRLGGSLL